MSYITDKLRRLQEASVIVLRHAADFDSRRVLLGCYASILTTSLDSRIVDFRLRIDGRPFPFRMRKCDIFTIGEILYEQQYCLKSSLDPAPTIVDIGANIGVSVLWFLGKYPGCRIHAFEPEPANFALLTSNAANHPGVVLNQLAVTADNSRVRLHLGEHGAVHSIADRSVGSKTIEVDSVALLDYLHAHQIGRVDLLKLDAEGCEAEVIEGLGNRIDDVQVIVGEFHERLVNENEFYDGLTKRGFELVSKTYFGNGKADGVHAFEMARRHR